MTARFGRFGSLDAGEQLAVLRQEPDRRGNNSRGVPPARGIRDTDYRRMNSRISAFSWSGCVVSIPCG